ncbi:MAG: SpoIIE family protein phosphatase, partial [Candidatus Eremiobacteraeota bacterium]|nr:SpoIIE family protein phosphatase [Candidatus Eremiobacteraeota bacterium]
PGFARAESFSTKGRVADRLQLALLPSRLATSDSLRFDAAYRPATDETVVGGDWYDAFEIGDGRIGISIGDVAGHGLETAVAMGEARRAIRTACADFASPREMLEYVNGILRFEEGVGMATAIAGFYDPSDQTFRYTSAGHPPPIYIAPDGRAHVLPAGGLPLGVPHGIGSEDWTITIEPGSSVVLYTDGLLEYTRDIIAGERILRSTVATIDFAGSPSAADGIHSAIFATVDNTDDAATLVLHGRGDVEPPKLHWSSFPGAAAIVRGSVRRRLAGSEASVETKERILAAVGEAVANAIEHGRTGGTFEMQTDMSGDALHVEVRNEGPWREYLRNEERGRGLPIMQSLADGVAITSTSASTGIRLSFSLAGVAS